MNGSEHPAQRASIASIRSVEAGDKATWLSLFADDAIVQDPVGVSPLDPTGLGHRGKEAIERFWDRVIARSKKTITMRESHPCADECANVLTIDNVFPGDKRVSVDLVSIYRVDSEGKIVSLKAYWEFAKLSAPAS